MKKNQKNAAFTKRTCVLCGRSIYSKENYIVGSTGRVVCTQCMENSRTADKLQFELPTPHQPSPHEEIMKPSELVQELDKSIIGQQAAKQAVAMALWKQLYRAKEKADMPKINLLLYGPSGCGKTAIVQKAAQLVDLPFLVVDSTNLTETGYRGLDAADIPKQLYHQYRDHPNFEYSIIFIDEVDKLAATEENPVRAQYSKGSQHTLLKMIEGDTVTFEEKDRGSISVSTQNFLFIFGGAFTALRKQKEESRNPQKAVRAPIVGFLSRQEEQPESDPVPYDASLTVEDFVRFGMEPELMGRIGQLIALDALHTEDLVRILCNSDLSAYVKYKKFLRSEGSNLYMSEPTARAIAQQAETQGLGARGMNSIVERLMVPVMCRFAEGYLERSVELRLEGGASA